MEEQLFEAAKIGNTEIFDEIQDPKILAKQNSQGDTACHLALQQGHLEFALKIASLHPPVLYTPNTKGDMVLHCALNVGQPEFFVQSVNLIRSFLGENIKYTNELPLKINSLMLEARRCYNASRDKEERSLVYLAATKGYFEAVKILMKTPALSSTDGPRRSTALHAAVRHSHYGIVQLLMQRRRSLIVHQDEDKLTPLLVAVSLIDVKMCNLLLMEDSIDILKIINGGDNGKSALHLAAQNDSLEIFRLFAERCPYHYNMHNELGENVLHIAIKAKALRIIKFIMKENELSSLMIKQCDNDGNTPLSLAATTNDNEEMLNSLLASSENVPLLNVDAENVQQKAIENYHSSLLVTATLVATVTFAAAFSLPGGYKTGARHEGTAALIGSTTFRVFLIFDVISLSASIITIAYLLTFAGTANFKGHFSVYFYHKRKKDLDFLRTAVDLLSVSLVSMAVAFAAGVGAVIQSECDWLTIIIVAVILCVIPYVIRGRLILGLVRTIHSRIRQIRQTLTNHD